MTAVAAILHDLATLPWGTLDEIIGPGRPLILAPHPDDESLGCGGLIAACCARGTPPCLVIVTDGSGSHPNSRTHPPERLRVVREQEARDAAAHLGMPAEAVAFLGLQDRAAPSAGTVFDMAVGAIASLLRVNACRTILAPWRHDPHCDHVATHAMATRIADIARIRHLSYPIWGWTLPIEHELPDSEPVGWRLDIAAHLPAKRAAIGAHASQYSNLIADDPSGFRLPGELLAVFARPYEVFLRMSVPASRDAAYFDRLYGAAPDPWNFAGSAYEHEKYAATLAVLSGRRFAAALEIGCSIGVLTSRFAAQCDALLAIDIAEAPLQQARARCRHLPQVTFERRDIPQQWPAGSFDLVVLSEVLYFLSPADIVAVAGQVLASLQRAGCVVLVNWLGANDAPCGGDEAARIFIAATSASCARLVARRSTEYRLDVLYRTG